LWRQPRFTTHTLAHPGTSSLELGHGLTASRDLELTDINIVRAPVTSASCKKTTSRYRGLGTWNLELQFGRRLSLPRVRQDHLQQPSWSWRETQNRYASTETSVASRVQSLGSRSQKARLSRHGDHSNIILSQNDRTDVLWFHRSIIL
jgi:hypothetical protein